ncbi:CDP-diacylglycerol--glycerol-3-phosphate 3-phosphatidyltransferase [Occultella gossypii]|uniref:CDP-diacylglycerol--glycerol-3-phosphate 3-phosphatidyltransferase n=1 Tax=Occultella gossypii TaxID=2800820 RepID=UPI001CBE0FC8|nr:CDP-diacylglycerol--glycerol-3-phosphate 3-phosphatidyltransferase [Occultella gossypii]
MTSESRSSDAATAEVWNLPNVLTMVRVVLVPVFAVLLWQDSTAARVAALVVFLVAAYTDRLDGQIARSRGIVTNFGKIADPFADKLLTGTAMVMLSIIDSGLMPWWATIAILVREIGITVLRFVMVRRGVVMPASKGGKLKTVLQIVFISLMLLTVALADLAFGDVLRIIAFVIMLAALAVTVVTGVDYCWKAWQSARSGGAAAAAPDAH